MFTGLIEGVGELASLHAGAAGLRLGIVCPALAPSLDIGASIAVDGVCLTVTSRDGKGFEAEAVGDTLEKTTLRKLRRGTRVNLERPLSAGGRLDGHFVMGHVAGRAPILSWGPAASSAKGPGRGDLEAWFLLIGLDPSWSDRIVPEGSIAVDGISLTVAGLERSGGPSESGRFATRGPFAESGRFAARISVIPHTRLATNLGDKRAGDEVNVELDVMASYVGAAVAAFLRRGAAGESPGRGGESLDMEQLKAWGYR
ncbi:MAG: riboflavin synthase [Treponema sp.]|nr:riboflavin synthase [Treponema sp.]